MLINLRNALMAGKRLPYDAEVEFLQSSGTQYIDTGVECTSDLDVDFVISTATAPNIATLGIIQQAPAGYSGYFRYHYSPSMQAAFWVQINALNTASISSIGFTPNKIYHWTVSPTLGIANCNGTSVSFAALPQGVRSGLNFYIFARNGFSGVQSMPSKVYSFKLRQNGVLVRDYIPVRKGNVGALYDRRGVGGMNPDGSPRNDGMYYNVGTGDFQYGQDVVPVEYIESHETEWIDTGVVPTTADSFYCRVKQSVIKDQAFWGVAGVAYCFSNWNGGGGNNGTYWGHPAIGLGGVNGVNPLGDTNWHEILCQPSGIFVDGAQINTQVSAQAQSPLNTVALFARANNSEGGGVAKIVRGRMSAFKVERNGDPLRKYLPVRVGTDATSWEGAMMDVLTRCIYRNAGTGAFTYGNDLKYPIPAE